MPLPPTIDDLDDDNLRKLYDPGALARGRAYAAEGRATVLRSKPGAISGTCRGSGSATYATAVNWIDDDGEVDVIDSCSCPIGEGCKHCVALILTARRQAIAAAPV